MLELELSGWFECRLATDPDPADEPRGVSGTTFACPGEPDLDRIIRFQPGSTNRVPGPAVGVVVTNVTRSGEAVDHPWRGARVELLGDPRFEGRNGLLGIPGTEAIHPLEVAVSGPGGLRLRRRDWLDAGDHGLLEAAPEAVARRAGGGIERGAEVAAAIGRATGIDDFLAHRRARAGAIEAALAAAGDPVRAAALRRRRAALSSIARMRVSYRLELGACGGGDGRIDGRPPGPAVDLRAPWPLRFWMGGWDADALCGFVAGTLALPEA